MRDAGQNCNRFASPPFCVRCDFLISTSVGSHFPGDGTSKKSPKFKTPGSEGRRSSPEYVSIASLRGTASFFSQLMQAPHCIVASCCSCL